MLTANPIHDLAAISVGQHLYWNVGPFEAHGQVLLTSWFVLGGLITFSLVSKIEVIKSKILDRFLQPITFGRADNKSDMSTILFELG